MSMRLRVVLWLVGLLVSSGAGGWTYQRFVEKQRAMGRLQAALVQDSVARDSLEHALKTLEVRRDTVRLTRWKTRYVGRRTQVRATLDAIDGAVAARAAAVATGNQDAPPPLPVLDPALVREALNAADSADAACTTVRVDCARENVILRRLRHSDSLAIGNLTAQLPSRRDRLRDGGIGAVLGALGALLLDHRHP